VLVVAEADLEGPARLRPAAARDPDLRLPPLRHLSVVGERPV